MNRRERSRTLRVLRWRQRTPRQYDAVVKLEGKDAHDLGDVFLSADKEKHEAILLHKDVNHVTNELVYRMLCYSPPSTHYQAMVNRTYYNTKKNELK